jgi:hypothetical protein
MNKPTRKHFVTFLSPGTLFAESTTRPIEAWEPRLAAQMAKSIVERYEARPFGFQFSTRIVGEMPDGSGTYFLGGVLRTLDEVEERADPKEDILRANMGGNGYWIVVEKQDGWRSTQPFEERDVLVDVEGNEFDRGDAPKWKAYRAECEAGAREDRVTPTATVRRPTPDLIARSRPKGIPDHAWPRFADYDAHPFMIGKAPAWWGWYLLDPYGRGIVYEVAGESCRDFTGEAGADTLRRQHLPRRVVDASREAAEAAFRLLCEASSPGDGR